LPIRRSPGSRTGRQIDQPDTRQRLVAERVGMPEQLQPAADGEDHGAAIRRGVQRVALDGREVLRAQRLVAVLAAAEVEEVVGVGSTSSPSPAPASSKPIPRHAQRRSSISRLPRSA
jgi:hypothetical protein